MEKLTEKEKLQLNYLKIILGLYRYTPNYIVFKEAKEMIVGRDRQEGLEIGKDITRKSQVKC